MTLPRGTGPAKFPHDQPGDWIKTGKWNDVLDAAARADSIGAGTQPSVSLAPFGGVSPEQPHVIRFVEVTACAGPEESSDFREATALVLCWDSAQYKWETTTHEVELGTDPHRHIPLDIGQRLVVWYHRQSGRYYPMAPPLMRHAVTVDDGEYPEEDAAANGCLFPVAHITASHYGGIVTGNATYGHLCEGGDEEEHVKVFNLATQVSWTPPLTAWISPDTIIPTWFANGRWWTYWLQETVAEESSSSSSSVSVSTSPSSTSISVSESSVSKLSSSMHERRVTMVEDVWCTEDNQIAVDYITLVFDEGGHLKEVCDEGEG